MGITPSANCVVGKYHMFVAVATPFGIRRTRRDKSRDLYILFNPWSPGQFGLFDEVLAPPGVNKQKCIVSTSDR